MTLMTDYWSSVKIDFIGKMRLAGHLPALQFFYAQNYFPRCDKATLGIDNIATKLVTHAKTIMSAR